MKVRFDTPKHTDFHFVRYTGFRPEDFGKEVEKFDSFGDMAVIFGLALAVLVMVSV